VLTGTVAGLIVAASYAFAPGAGAAMLSFWLFFVVAPLWSTQRWQGSPAAAAGAATILVPCGLVVGLVCGHNLRTFPMDTLTWGTFSFVEMFQSIAERVFLPPSPDFTAPVLAPVLASLSAHFAVLVPAVFLVALVATGIETRFTRFCAVLTLATLGGFLGMVLVLGVRWPLGRTALVLMAPLKLLVAGVLVDAGRRRLSSYRAALGGTCLALLCAGFLAALRLESFEEWSYDADVREAVESAGRYMIPRGLRRIGTTWHYTSTANYYRGYLGLDLDPIRNDANEELFDGYPVYFVPPGADDFIADCGLRVIFEGRISGMRVAVRPD
jgi:hypothetical protein